MYWLGICRELKILCTLLWVAVTQMCAHVKFIELHTQDQCSLSTLMYTCYTTIWKIVCRPLAGRKDKVCWLPWITTTSWTGREVRLVRFDGGFYYPVVGKGGVREAPKGLAAGELFLYVLLRNNPFLIDAYLKSCTQCAIIFKAIKNSLLGLHCICHHLGWAQSIWYPPYWTQTTSLRSRDTAESLSNLPEVKQLVRDDVLFSPYLIN